MTDHTVHQLVLNCTRLQSLSVAACPLLTDNALLHIATHSPTLRHVLCVAKPPERIAAELLFFLSSVTTLAPTLRHVLCVAKSPERIAALLFFLSLVASLRITNRSFKHAAPLVSGIKSQLLAPRSWKRSNQISEYKRGLSIAGRWLDVAGCSRLSNVGVKTLATACTHLQHLDLSSTPVNHHRCALTPALTCSTSTSAAHLPIITGVP